MAKSILVVDDDPDTLTLIGLTLQRRGFEVLKAQGGKEALGLLAHDLPDLVILDVMMPHMDGYEVCHVIKTDPRTAQLPVVMLTAKAQTASQLEGFRAGAIDYITKPVHPQELVTRIQAVLERTNLPEDRPRSQLIGVSGAKGGVGATTLAVNLALALAASHRTALIDLEPSGTAGIHLGLTSDRGLTDLSNYETMPLDEASVLAALTPHTSGLQVLMAGDGPLDPARITLVLNYLLAQFDVCICDLGWGLGQTVRTVAPRCNTFVLATDADRASLTQANRLLHLLDDGGMPSGTLKLVWINRQSTPVDLATTAIHAALGRDPDATINAAPEAMYTAMEHGRPLVADQPDEPVAVQLRVLAASLLPAK
jgi:DNA-binding response OmpR family regulator